MFKRGGLISRSLHAPRGVNIHGVSKQQLGPSASKLKRKFSWASSRVRGAVSESALTHRPLVLKEGFLYKPGFLRIGGRKRRWCVLRTYNQTEASLDIYTDETKNRYKGSVTLDRDVSPMLVVKNYDSKKKTAKNCFLSIKVAKHSYQFAADSFKELREWAALLRQAIDNGHIYSGKVTEPQCIEEGTVNVKFHINCIALICPLTEKPIKKWRLDHITSFGQCGGILTFECCSTCSEASTARCCINIVQEKPSTILNLMEKAIRNNPNTGEIHYERSILGDIYHCDHDCCQTQRLLPAFSDPNIFRSSTSSPLKGITTVPVDVHADFDIPSNTLGSNDSGLPGTPKQPDALSINSNIPSPTQQNSRSSPYRSGRYQNHRLRSMSTTEASQVSPYFGEVTMQYARRQSDESQRTSGSYNNGDGMAQQEATRRRLVYTAVRPDSVRKSAAIEEDSVTYSTVNVTSPTADDTRQHRRSGGLVPLNENDGIYDYPPVEPSYWDIGGDGAFSPPGTPQRNDNGLTNRKAAAQSTLSIYELGSDIREREEDFEELPPVPKHNRRTRPPTKELVKLNSTGTNMTARHRLHSTGDVLESSRPIKTNSAYGHMGSMDNLDQAGRNRSYSLANPLADSRLGNAEFLSKLHEEDEMLTRMLAASRRERNEEVIDDSRAYLSPNSPRTPYSLSPISSRKNVDKFLTKKASDTVRGYAYKIQIPLSNTEYDVPRRAAPAPDLTNLRSDAPPKPLRS